LARNMVLDRGLEECVEDGQAKPTGQGAEGDQGCRRRRARRATGSASRASGGMATSRGRLGRARSRTMPPRTDPRPKAATIVAQAGAPPSERAATTGPRTNIGARTAKLPRAENTPSTQSQVPERK